MRARLVAVAVLALVPLGCSDTANDAPKPGKPETTAYGGDDRKATDPACSYAGRWADFFADDVEPIRPPETVYPPGLDAWASRIREDIATDCPNEMDAFNAFVETLR